MRDGSVRVRNRPLSEKMQPGESVQEACLRGVLEELGPELGHPSRVSLVHNSLCTEVEDRDSVLYPGLPSRYTIHTVVAFVDGLPDTPSRQWRAKGAFPMYWRTLRRSQWLARVHPGNVPLQREGAAAQ